MKRKTLFTTVLVTISISLLITSCEKDKDEEQPLLKESLESAEDNAMVETEFSTIFDAADDVAAISDANIALKESAQIGYTVLPSGAVVAFTDSLFNDGDGIEFSIDFGELGTKTPMGIVCKDGRYRAGQIDVMLSDRFFKVGSVLQILVPESNNYHFGDGTNMTHVSGTKIVTRTDTLTRTVVVTDGKAVTEEGTVLWESARTVSKTYDDGIGIWGDEYTIFGTASGTNRNGVNFTATVEESEPLVKSLKIGCYRTFISGVVTLVNDNGGYLKLDYDPYNNQACDRAVEITINGNSWIRNVW